MKKLGLVGLVIASALLTACSSTASDSRTFSGQTTVDDVLQSGIAQAEYENTSEKNESTTSNNQDKNTSNVSFSENVDVDLTSLSSTVVYSEVYNIMSTPENYIGKTIKMSGIFSATHDDITNKDYYACIIKDATACCAQGIEFVLADGYEYPEVGDTICVVGTFDTYNEGQFRYSTLREAKILE